METTVVVAAAAAALGAGAAWRACVRVFPGEVVALLRFGRLAGVFAQPGLHARAAALLPGTRWVRVSRRMDFRRFPDLRVNDRDGTTISADVWLEFRIVDPARALFAVEEWEVALSGVVRHSVSVILGSQPLGEIVGNRTELSARLRSEIAHETERWGIEVLGAELQNVGLLPEIARRFFDRVAARLEQEKSRIDEEGRIGISRLQAKTEAEIAELRALAKSEHPLAVGRAYARIRHRPRVFAAFEELYRLSLLAPGQMVAFRGFGEGDLRAIEAAMLPGAAPAARAAAAEDGDARAG